MIGIHDMPNFTSGIEQLPMRDNVPSISNKAQWQNHISNSLYNASVFFLTGNSEVSIERISLPFKNLRVM